MSLAAHTLYHLSMCVQATTCVCFVCLHTHNTHTHTHTHARTHARTATAVRNRCGPSTRSPLPNGVTSHSTLICITAATDNTESLLNQLKLVRDNTPPMQNCKGKRPIPLPMCVWCVCVCVCVCLFAEYPYAIKNKTNFIFLRGKGGEREAFS